MAEHWLDRDKKSLAAVLPRATDLVAVKGEGSWLYDVDGNRYLDFASGIAVNNTGHCHPAVAEAICDQATKLIHTSVTTHNLLTIKLAEQLGRLCPFFEEPQVFFCNSGAEAVDGSLKLARMVTGRPGVIAFRGSFHGRTIAATSLTTAKAKYRTGYDPHLPYVYHFSYNTSPTNLEGLYSFIQNAPYKIGSMIVEPVLGEGGYIVPSVKWLQGLRDSCNQHNIMLIFDEVQCGIGRTGYPFASEAFGITPDILLFAKGIASGLPLGGIIAPKEIMDQWPTGTHGSTFGGNPVSCAAALATLEVLAPLYERVRWSGKSILYRLAPWGARGIGYMIGIELENKEQVDNVKTGCLRDGLLILSCGTNDNVIRLIPPLTASDYEIDLGLTILERNLNEY